MGRHLAHPLTTRSPHRRGGVRVTPPAPYPTFACEKLGYPPYSGAEADLSAGKYCIGSTGAEFLRTSK
jgi:hypothetical protein